MNNTITVITEELLKSISSAQDNKIIKMSVIIPKIKPFFHPFK